MRRPAVDISSIRRYAICAARHICSSTADERTTWNARGDVACAESPCARALGSQTKATERLAEFIHVPRQLFTAYRCTCRSRWQHFQVFPAVADLPVHLTVAQFGPQLSGGCCPGEEPLQHMAEFGSAVAIRDGIAFIGIPGALPTARVAVFNQTATGWARTATLTAPDAASVSQFWSRHHVSGWFGGDNKRRGCACLQAQQRCMDRHSEAHATGCP